MGQVEEKPKLEDSHFQRLSGDNNSISFPMGKGHTKSNRPITRPTQAVEGREHEQEATYRTKEEMLLKHPESE